MNSAITTSLPLWLSNASVIYIGDALETEPQLEEKDGLAFTVGKLDIGNPLYPLYIDKPFVDYGSVDVVHGGDLDNEIYQHITDFFAHAQTGLFIARKIGKDSTNKYLFLDNTNDGILEGDEVSIFSTVGANYRNFDTLQAIHGIDILVTSTPTNQLNINLKYDKLTDVITVSVDSKNLSLTKSGTVEYGETYIGYSLDRREVQIRVDKSKPLFDDDFNIYASFTDLVKESGDVSLDSIGTSLRRLSYVCDYSFTSGETDKDIVRLIYDISKESLIQTAIDVKADTVEDGKSIIDSIGIGEASGAIYLLNRDSMIVNSISQRIGTSGDFIGQRVKQNRVDRTRAIMGIKFPISRTVLETITFTDDDIIYMADNHIVPIFETKGILNYADTLGSGLADFVEADINFFIRRGLADILESHRGENPIIARSQSEIEGKRYIDSSISKYYFKGAKVELVEEENGELCFKLGNDPIKIFRRGRVISVPYYEEEEN